MPRRHRRPGGMTLCEVLVSTLVIGTVLAAILLPSLRRAKALAQAAVCQSQLRNQGIAHSVYARDYDDRKPPNRLPSELYYQRFPYDLAKTYDQTFDGIPVSHWAKVMGQPLGQGLLIQRRYISLESLVCPSARMPDNMPVDDAGWQTVEDAGSCYAYWCYYACMDPAWRGNKQRVTYALCERSNQDALAMDINADPNWPRHVDRSPERWFCMDKNWARLSHPLLGRVNVLYIGGSVFSHESSDLIMLYGTELGSAMVWFQKAHRMH